MFTVNEEMRLLSIPFRGNVRFVPQSIQPRSVRADVTILRFEKVMLAILLKCHPSVPYR